MERIKKALQLAGQERVAAADVPATPDGGDAATGRAPRSPPVDVADIEYNDTRVLAVGAKTLESERVVTGRGRDVATEAYKVLRTQVLQRLQKEGWQTIAVVSPAAGEGKTLTAINLAISLANNRSVTTLLVDLDMRQPSVHEHFAFAPTYDVCSVLRGEQPLSAALVNPGLPRFCFLPCREPVSDSSEQLGGLGGFVTELKERYRNRIVLFDLPPLLATDDALTFLPLVDCALLVVEEGKTKREEVVRSLELIGPQRLLGSVMNKSRQARLRY